MKEPITIPFELLEFRVSRSSGPGGQHVNKTDTRVEALLAIDHADFLDEGQKERVKQKLAKRISKEGYLAVVCQATRSQITNKERAIAKMTELINKAVEEEKPRKPTSIPKAVQEKRLKTKKEQSQKKQSRGDWKKLI